MPSISPSTRPTIANVGSRLEASAHTPGGPGTERPISPEEATQLFTDFPGVTVVDDLEQGVYPMPSNSDDLDDVFVGRIRKDISCDNGLAFWCVSDNLRKGAATNAVQIAELLVSGKVSQVAQ